jgi:hypothetical protein
MTKSRDPNSNRSHKRAKRNFTASRPERRAERRLNAALGAYDVSNAAYTKPGAIKHW